MRIDYDERLTKGRLHEPGPPGNLWLLPAEFEVPPGVAAGTQAYTQCIVARNDPANHNYAATGEPLVPAPAGAKPRRTVRRYMTVFRVRKPIHFFVGIESGLPAAVGWVEETPAVTAADFAARVAASGIKELAPFSPREAAFTLNAVANIEAGSPVSVSIAERIDAGVRHEALSVRRVARALVG